MRKYINIMLISIILLSLIIIIEDRSNNKSSRGSATNIKSRVKQSDNADSKKYLNLLGLNEFININKISWNELGSGVTIGVIDTGINDRVSGESVNCFDDGKVIRRDYIRDVSDVQREYPNTYSNATSGHGTEISSVISCPEGTNKMIGDTSISVSGTAPGSKIVSINAFPTSGDLSPKGLRIAILQAYRAGAKVINVSLGMSDNFLSRDRDINDLNNTIEDLYKKNILIVSSSGNDGPDKVSAPAIFPKVITVGSVSTGFSIVNTININGERIESIGGEIGWLRKDTSASIFPEGGYLVDGCSKLGEGYFGKFGVIWRGGCSFETKLINLKNAGASGGIIVDGNSNTTDFTLSHLSEVKYDFPMVLLKNSDFKKLNELISRYGNNMSIERSLFRYKKSNSRKINTFSSFKNESSIKPELVNFGGGVFTVGFNCRDCGSFSDGTSEASALTSGIIASFWAQHPEYTAEMVRNIIIESSSSKVYSYLGNSFASYRMAGFGLPDLKNAEKVSYFTKNSVVEMGAKEIRMVRIKDRKSTIDSISYNGMNLEYKNKDDEILINGDFNMYGEVLVKYKNGGVSRILVTK